MSDEANTPISDEPIAGSNDAATPTTSEAATAVDPNAASPAELDAAMATAVAGDDVQQPGDPQSTTSADDDALGALDGVEAELTALLGAENAQSTAGARPFVAPALEPGAAPNLASIELLDDVELDVKIELGRTEMRIEDVLQLGAGSVVELDKLAGDPVDIFINERLVARGEVLVLNDNFCVRVNEILSPIPELEGSA
jgi:flagellar motor switch protein FliN/FliY